ncbi:MAG: type II secretion system protein [Candidatus Nomurabacteria bacterium]|nr:MAG: type II secretion system protein [Candidatus Nomurabacteria bacterium]
MNKQQEQSKRAAKSGFTIIEVVLVLAIAGLIFLMVFIALPSLQRSQRDAQRKDDLSRFLSQVSSYQSNHRGDVPTAGSVNSFISQYLTVGNDKFQDPQSGGDYTHMSINDKVPKAGDTSTTPGDANINYVAGKSASCNDDGSPHVTGGSGRSIAVSIGLEAGGAYCQTN